jgi:hypothetical protein
MFDLTILIPTYNRNEELRITLKQFELLVLKSNLKIEIIVSDNCSNVDPISLKEEFNKIQIIFIRNEFNLGISKNILNGIRKVQGKYLWVFGDDDLVNPSLFKYLELFVNNNWDFLQIKRKSFHSEIDLCFESLEVKLENFNALNDAAITKRIDSDCGFIGSNIFRFSIFLEAIDKVGKRGDYLNNNYWIKLINSDIILSSNKKYRIELPLIYQRIVKGSHFYKNPEIIYKTFFLDIDEILRYHSCYNPSWPDLRHTFFKNKMDLIIIKVFSKDSFLKILKINQLSRFRNFFSLCLLILPALLIKNSYIIYLKIINKEISKVFLNNEAIK